jgi:hypothetical protein
LNIEEDAIKEFKVVEDQIKSKYDEFLKELEKKLRDLQEYTRHRLENL